jgi:hypothetical protein
MELMRLSALSLGLSVLVCQSNWLAAFAQGDPVITPSGPQPKFEVIETPNNNNQIFLQNLQNFQNQQNAFFNNPALNLNPSITGLDQRSGLIQNSTNVNMFGVNGLAINSYNVPKINNSNLMAISDVVGWSKDLANFLIKTDPKMNIDRDLIPKLNNTSTPHLISALVMALGLPQDLLIDFVGRATTGGLESVRNSLIQLAAAIKTGKITPADAQKALLQIVSGAQQMKSSMVYTPPASTTTTSIPNVVTSVVNQISSIIGPKTVVSNTGAVTPVTTVTNINPTSIKSAVPQVTIVSATAQAVPNVTVSSIKTTTTPISNSTTNSNSPITSVTSISSIPISELSKNLLEGKDKIDTKLIETAIQVQNTTSSTASVTVSKSEKESSLGDKMNKIESAMDKIQNATQNKTTTTISNTATTIGTVVNDPVKLATNNANAIVSTVSNVVSSITNALSIPISNSSAKAVTTNTNYVAPPVIPNPVVLATATIINLQVTRLNLPPIIAAAVMTKAALGHFNNMPGAVTSLAQVLMTPGVTPKEAQALLIGFLEATGKPNDIPVATIVALMPATASTASTPAPTKDQVVQKLTAITNFVKEMATGLSKSNNSAINTNSMAKMVTAINETMTSTTNQMQGMISGSGTTMDSLMNAMQNTMNTMQTIQTGGKY